MLGRLTTVTVIDCNSQAVSGTTQYAYDVAGDLTREVLPNGVVADYQYDQVGRLLDLTYYSGGGMTGDLSGQSKIADFSYTPLADGKRGASTETFWQNGTPEVQQYNWTYDNLGRLTDEVFQSYDPSLDYTAHYDYDLVGNRLRETIDHGNTGAIDEVLTYGYDANDRLLTNADNAGDSTKDRYTVYGYGLGNNSTEETGQTIYQGLDDTGPVVEQDTYAYNPKGQMSSAMVDQTGSGGGVTNCTYAYDDNGIRVSQTVNGQKTVYLNAANNPTGYTQVLQEKDGSGNVLRTYTLGLNIISQGEANGTVYFLLYDAHGSTRALLNTTGEFVGNNGVRQILTYDAFGNAIGFNPGDALTSHLYNGERTDSTTGFQYLGQHYYDLATGRFTSRDPGRGTCGCRRR